MAGNTLADQISVIYSTFGGRPAAAGEIAIWTDALQRGTQTLDTLRTAVIDDAGLGRSYLPGAITTTYQQYGGRAATGGEVAIWTDAIRNHGATLATLKTAVIDDAYLGATYLGGAITATYQQYGGRAANGGEVAIWTDAIRNHDATLATLKTAVIDDAYLGATYLGGAITATYQQYGGRAATGGEVAIWTDAIRNHGATLATLKTAVIDDAYLGATYLGGAITATYQQYGGRAATGGEVAIWTDAIRNHDATLGTLKTAVIDDAYLGATYLGGAITATYQQYGGRAANGGEVAIWTDAIRNHGATLATLKTAVIDDAYLGATYLGGAITATYQQYGGRAATGAETAAWVSAIRNDGSALDTVKQAILNDPLGAAHAASVLTSFYATYDLNPSAGEIQGLLASLRSGSSWADAESALLGAHANEIYDRAAYEGYATYLGRAPFAAELNQLHQTAPSLQTVGQDLAASLLASAGGQMHTTATITAEYQQWAGRAPTSGELATWHGLIDAQGATFDTIRVSILSSSDGASQAPGAITSLYQEYLGRAPTAVELQDDINTLGANQDFAAIQRSVFTKSEGVIRFFDQLHSLYTSIVGRDFTTDEQGQWFDAIYSSGATYETMRATLMMQSTSGVSHAVGTAANDILYVPGQFGQATVANFDPMHDVIRLDPSFASIPLLDASHAQQVLSADGITPNVLITLDSQDTLLIHGVNLAQLSASDFLFS